MASSKIPKVDGLEDWEIGLLSELRILKEADVLDHALDAIASTLEVLYAEADRIEAEKIAKERDRVIKKESSEHGPLADGLMRVHWYRAMTPPKYLRALITQRTVVGGMLAKSGYKRREILKVFYQEIAEKARMAGILRCRRYVGNLSK
jgi:hypothetical protein